MVTPSPYTGRQLNSEFTYEDIYKDTGVHPVRLSQWKKKGLLPQFEFCSRVDAAKRVRKILELIKSGVKIDYMSQHLDTELTTTKSEPELVATEEVKGVFTLKPLSDLAKPGYPYVLETYEQSFREKLGNTIKMWRHSMDISQGDFALKIRASHGTVANIELGKFPMQKRRFKAIAEVIGISEQDLMNGMLPASPTPKQVYKKQKQQPIEPVYTPINEDKCPDLKLEVLKELANWEVFKAEERRMSAQEFAKERSTIFTTAMLLGVIGIGVLVLIAVTLWLR